METFSVIVDEAQYTISPMDDGSFALLSGDDRLGHIYKKTDTAKGDMWTSDDDIDPHIIAKVGEIIEQYHL